MLALCAVFYAQHKLKYDVPEACNTFVL